MLGRRAVLTRWLRWGKSLVYRFEIGGDVSSTAVCEKLHPPSTAPSRESPRKACMHTAAVERNNPLSLISLNINKRRRRDARRQKNKHRNLCCHTTRSYKHYSRSSEREQSKTTATGPPAPPAHAHRVARSPPPPAIFLWGFLSTDSWRGLCSNTFEVRLYKRLIWQKTS